MERRAATALGANDLKFVLVFKGNRFNNCCIKKAKLSLQLAVKLPNGAVDFTVALGDLIVAHRGRCVDHKENILGLFILLVKVWQEEGAILHTPVRRCERVVTDFLLDKIIKDRSPIQDRIFQSFNDSFCRQWHSATIFSTHR